MLQYMDQYKIPTHDQFKKILQYCEEHISPRKYWLHNRAGGLGWVVYLTNDGYYLHVDDTKHLTFLILSQ